MTSDPHTRPPSPRDTRLAVQLAIVGGTVAAAGLGAVASLDAQASYHALRQPSWAPSAAVFGPVWTILYALMATAACGVARHAPARAARAALAPYALQLARNAAWTWLFFRWHMGAWALAEVVALLAVVALTAWRFGRIRAWAGACLVPYLLWVGFATALTAALWQLNPTTL